MMKGVDGSWVHAINILAFPDKFRHRVPLSSRSIKIFCQCLLEYVLVPRSLSRPLRIRRTHVLLSALGVSATGFSSAPRRARWAPATCFPELRPPVLVTMRPSPWNPQYNRIRVDT